MSYLFTIGLDKMKGAIPFMSSIDDVTDQINRNTMTRLMVMWAILSTFNQLIGANISCLKFTKFDKDFAEQYCWTQGIYTHMDAYDMPGQTPYPGIAPCVGRLNIKTGKINYPCNEKEMFEKKVFHSWYQWVPFYYIAVAVAYYFPYLILKTTKLRRIKPLINLLKDENIIDQHPKMVVKKVSTWLYNEVVYPRYATTSSFHRFWGDFSLVFGVTAVKFLYFVIAIGHMLLTARMFKIGNWITYGLMFGMPTGGSQTHVKDVLFPKVVACRIEKWAASGLEFETGMCTLALNVMYQYLFLVMWYLNVALIFLNAISWFYTMFKFLNPNITHKWIVNSSMMQTTADFTRMFGYIGPSGRIVVAKLSENMSGYMLAMVSSKVVKKIDSLQRRRKNKPALEFYRINGAPPEMPRQPLMESAALAFGVVPQCMTKTNSNMNKANNNITMRPRSNTMS
ncbi:innexin shaking-B-like isoform X2 [Bolinopsis microptera]|uniref:innexin shaking-B-like isoform X2 n=1 Tax=Bolinopsis microptera TaxID=2820187 RepID=UPI00307AFBE2